MSIRSSWTRRLHTARLDPYHPVFRISTINHPFFSTSACPQRFPTSPFASPFRYSITVPQSSRTNNSIQTFIYRGTKRDISWRSIFRPGLANPRDANDGVSQSEEEAAKFAILEKSFDSRQSADIMLRCELLPNVPCSF
jgi:hypothetical protein